MTARSTDALRSDSRRSGWWIVGQQEVRDLWLSGRAPVLMFGFSLVLSAVSYLAATNQALNFLEQRETVNLTVQVGIAVGALVTMAVAADGISGERERGTLESLLLTPVSRRAILGGKLVAALSLWLAVLVVTSPYVWVLGRGVSLVTLALVLSLVVGTLVAAGLAALALLISAVSSSNKVSLATGFFVLLALFAPSQLPASQVWFFEVLLRLNPVASAMHYVSAVLVAGHGWTRDLSYLVSPVVLVVLAGGTLVVAGSRMVRLQGGVSDR